MSKENYEKELNTCPECSSNINADNAEFHGGGYMTREVWCTGEDCRWEGTEEWEISQTLVD